MKRNFNTLLQKMNKNEFQDLKKILDNNQFFDKKQKAISSGQFAAWYKEKELIGSGIIH